MKNLSIIINPFDNDCSCAEVYYYANFKLEIIIGREELIDLKTLSDHLAQLSFYYINVDTFCIF